MAKRKSTKSENDNYEDMKQKKGHKQEGGEKVAEGDMDEQRENQEGGDDADDLGDPFQSMMKQASRNARYTVAFIPNRGTVDANDPMGATPDEHDNDPKVRKKK